MKRLLLLIISVVILGAANGNSFEFQEESFGNLKPDKIKCEEKEDAPYSDLVFRRLPKGKSCFLIYKTENNWIEEGGSEVVVSVNRLNNLEDARRYWIHPDFDLPPVGMKVQIREDSDNFYWSYSWISSTYYIHITQKGPPVEGVQDIKDYYMDKYPPTYTVSATDLKKENINKYELHRHMQIIRKGEEYRGLLKSKADKYIGTMAQCQEEATIRAAAGLCKEAIIVTDQDLPPDLPPDRLLIDCPIALNFNSAERKEQWKDLEKAALESETLDLNPRAGQCRYVGPGFITMPVACKLNFTEEEYLKVREQGDIPEQFPLSYANKEVCARDLEMKKDFRIYKDGP